MNLFSHVKLDVVDQAVKPAFFEGLLHLGKARLDRIRVGRIRQVPQGSDVEFATLLHHHLSLVNGQVIHVKSEMLPSHFMMQCLQKLLEIVSIYGGVMRLRQHQALCLRHCCNHTPVRHVIFLLVDLDIGVSG